MSRLRSAWTTVIGIPKRIYRWQSDIPDEGRVTLAGLLLLAAGLTILVGVGWAFAIAGAVLVLAGLGFDLRRGGKT